MTQPLVDPQLAAFWASDPTILAQTPEEEVQEQGLDAKTVAEVGIALSVAFLVYRRHISNKLAQEPIDMREGAAERLAYRMWKEQAPYWLQLIVPAIKQGYALGKVEGLTKVEADQLAISYANNMGEYLNQTSAEALIQGFHDQLAAKWSPELAWQRATYAYGLDKRQMKSYVKTLLNPQENQKFEVIPWVSRTLVDKALMTRADRVGQHEAWHSLQMGKAFSWLIMQSDGTLPADTQKQWITAEDERVCPICAPLDKKRVNVNERFRTEDGEELWAPGVHTNCRCDIAMIYPEIKNDTWAMVEKFDSKQPRDKQGRWSVGFTGTRNGMTPAQRKAVWELLQKENPTEVHHGDDKGADTDFHQLAHRHKSVVRVHPPDNAVRRAFNEGHEVHQVKPYLKRNRDIVDNSDVLIATPSSSEEVLRSGTWATIRYAKKQNKKVIQVNPDGSVQDSIAKDAPGDPYNRDVKGEFARRETRRGKPVKEREVDPAVEAILREAQEVKEEVAEKVPPPPGWVDRKTVPPPPGWVDRKPPPGWVDRKTVPPPGYVDRKTVPPPPGWVDRKTVPTPPGFSTSSSSVPAPPGFSAPLASGGVPAPPGISSIAPPGISTVAPPGWGTPEQRRALHRRQNLVFIRPDANRPEPDAGADLGEHPHLYVLAHQFHNYTSEMPPEESDTVPIYIGQGINFDLPDTDRGFPRQIVANYIGSTPYGTMMQDLQYEYGDRHMWDLADVRDEVSNYLTAGKKVVDNIQDHPLEYALALGERDPEGLRRVFVDAGQLQMAQNETQETLVNELQNASPDSELMHSFVALMMHDHTGMMGSIGQEYDAAKDALAQQGLRPHSPIVYVIDGGWHKNNAYDNTMNEVHVNGQYRVYHISHRVRQLELGKDASNIEELKIVHLRPIDEGPAAGEEYPESRMQAERMRRYARESRSDYMRRLNLEDLDEHVIDLDEDDVEDISEQNFYDDE
jgi:hypothetical protein